MNKSEYESLEELSSNTISIHDLYNFQPRTLIYGYTLNRETFHIYFLNSQIHKLIYSGGTIFTTIKKERKEDPLKIINSESNSSFNISELIPDKRAYPERCDYEFCKLLKSKGAEIPFTSWQDLPHEIIKQDFYGRLIGDLSLKEE